ncbi:response regulator, putative [Trichophyton benhamiae CBS 112371]|uniref:Response regulator, putative n=1 Tax=Arthroderma benhamiae (strain ATCC MYA-4681 / CBS 112371) TaxID=663331 RepID=D4ARB6_ARTBC|nr:response regulator, putative [Trichophyton benhamiae CBS 112371]EFE34259.1 response regulator, putative [Trichophyton benhamiae CBS 112371]
MPAEKERRFSRLAALLRRPSSSSSSSAKTAAAAAADPAATSTSATASAANSITTAAAAPASQKDKKEDLKTASRADEQALDDAVDSDSTPRLSPWTSLPDQLPSASTTTSTTSTTPTPAPAPPATAASTTSTTSTAAAATATRARRTPRPEGHRLGVDSRPNRAPSLSSPSQQQHLQHLQHPQHPPGQPIATAVRSAPAARQVPSPLIESPATSNPPLPRARLVSVDNGNHARRCDDFAFAPSPNSQQQHGRDPSPAQLQGRIQRQFSRRGSVGGSARQLNTITTAAAAAASLFDDPHQGLQSPTTSPISASPVSAAAPGRSPQIPEQLPKGPRRPSLAVRRQSLVPASQQRLINTLLEPPYTSGAEYFPRSTPAIQFDMINRKVWVKRPGSSPTLVLVTEEDLVDDLRDSILKKYANSLGRTIDSPDIVIRLIQREPSSRHGQLERVLGPEEPLTRTLDHFYPGGQTIDEALIIEVPPRRTPKASPLTPYAHTDDSRGMDQQGGYFPPMHMITPNSATLKDSMGSPHPNSMQVINTGQVPPIPSPGVRGPWQQPQHRSSYHQYAGSQGPGSLPSPSNGTYFKILFFLSIFFFIFICFFIFLYILDINGFTYVDSVNPHPPANGVPTASSPPSAATPPALPSEPAPKSVSPPSRVASPRPKGLEKLNKNSSTNSNPLPTSLLDGAIPPINVLIVEDNTINLKLLEAFMKRLKVRWQTAMNGREAVNKWREGGFHLVLMDIQLPVMSGLEATREIRRLERVNNIGVFQRSAGPSYSASMVGSTPTSPSVAETPSSESNPEDEVKPEDLLNKENQFKSPVIIVALTASSLQSDRHEALAAGCNDFLTKPVNIVWLEQKVTEWGCMQALIDFEGWRKWRGFSDLNSDSTIAATIRKGKENAGPALTPSDATPRKLNPIKSLLAKSSNGNLQSKSRAAPPSTTFADGTDDSSTVSSTTTTIAPRADGGLSTPVGTAVSPASSSPTPVATRRLPVASKAQNGSANGSTSPQTWKNSQRNGVPVGAAPP